MDVKFHKITACVIFFVAFSGCIGSSDDEVRDCTPPGGPENIYVMYDPNSPYYLTLRTDTPYLADADSWERNPLWAEGVPGEEQFRPNPNQDCPADGLVSGPDQVAFVEQGFSYYPTKFCCR